MRPSFGGATGITRIMESLIEHLLMGLHPPDLTLMQYGYRATMKDVIAIGVGYQVIGELKVIL